jgi:hypothetical protein
MRIDDKPSPNLRAATMQPAAATEPDRLAAGERQTVWINLRPHVGAYEPYLIRSAQTPTIIKARIQVQFGVPWTEQRLCLDGVELDDHKSLQEQGLPNHAVVNLCVEHQAQQGPERP